MKLRDINTVLNCDRLKIKEERTCNTILDNYCDLDTYKFNIPDEILDRDVVNIGVGLENSQIVIWIN